MERVEGLGRTLHQGVIGGDLSAFSKNQAERDPAFSDFGRAMAGHFWCDLLAEVANALSRGAELSGKLPDGIREAVLEHEDTAPWGTVRARLAEAALGFLWRSFQVLLGADLTPAVLHLRILAVLICPDPGSHPRVSRCCLRPLAKEILRDHLRIGLDPEWLWGDRP